jgi:AraC-like DNA-binding protein
MDALVGFLDGPRARGAFMLRAVMDPPWSMRIEDEAPLTLVAIARGSVVVVTDDGGVTQLGPGDVAVMRGPDHYTMADRADTPVNIIIGPDQRCTTLDGIELTQSMGLGIRTWGNSVDGEAVILVGTYEKTAEVSRRLIKALPPLVVVPDNAWDNPLIVMLADEIVKDAPGQDVVLDRLLDLLLITSLRTWFARPEAEAPAWYRAHSDPIVGKAIQMLHNRPDHQWTVANLASETGVSRAALARRFTELVGEPPMAFLTEWRLALAADLLREPGATVTNVAQQVGYGSPFALSAAFKRVRGISPKEHRLAAVGA